MNNQHDDWFKGLERDPFPEKGFQPELKRRIMREIDRKPAAKPRPNWRLAGIAAACMTVVCLLVLLRVELFPNTAPLANNASLNAGSPLTEVLDKKEIKSVLLLGLRQDNAAANEQNSTYRSLMVANQNGQVKAVAAGNGILVPYGQVFWKIDNAADPKAEGKTLHIAQAGKAAAPSPTAIGTQAVPETKEPAVRVEKLLYAGNKYLSLETGDAATGSSELWNVDLKEYANGGDPLFSRQNLSEFTEGRYSSDSWTVLRQTGSWKAAVRSAETGLEINPKSKPLTPAGIPLTLVNTELSDRLVNHDTLDRPWEDILAIEPEATDSVTSPDRDLMAIFTDHSIEFFEFSAQAGDQPLLTVARNKGEQLVMVQWALEKYASKWIQAGESELLP
ncbi:hypothetical protein [Gorillibacterium sp. sgz500922]|uniref:hypothetical protein n=1 Tax=Gorillibacterium sp. sgz500922 TaxID=3446694 RepID=UPI003F675D49